VEPWPLNFRVDHPLLAPCLVCRRKTKGLLNTAAKVFFREAVLAFLSNCRKHPGAQQGDEQEIVEMASLECCILAVVRETQKLALVFGNGATGSVHPAEDAGYQKGGS
jgi:hypothetical protein